MVVPEPIVNAAREGNVTAVREWLESGGDPNDRIQEGSSALLVWVIVSDESEARLEIVRLLLAHGADVNCYLGGEVGSYNPLHICSIFPHNKKRCGRIFQLLLDAGANLVNARTNQANHNETRLGVALDNSIWHAREESRNCLDTVIRLLRAGATLDACKDNLSAESLLRQKEASCAERQPPREMSPPFHACKALMSDYRAAGSTWKSYVRAPPKALLRLRSLVARGRARERIRLHAKTPRGIALLFAPTFPNELFWNVASYWNPRY